MTLSIHTSLHALSGDLSRSHGGLALSVQRLSSGLRVRRAADDPAGLAVAVNLSTAVVSERQAMRNLNDGQSMLEVAESATSEAAAMLQRMRELAVQGASETLDDDSRAILHDEFAELRTELDRVAETTAFNGLTLTNGSIPSLDVYAGAGTGAANRITLSFQDLRSATVAVDGLDVSTLAGAQGALEPLDQALDTLNLGRAELGASFRRLESALGLSLARTVNLASAASTIRDTDYATEPGRVSRLRLQMDAAGLALGDGLRALGATTALIDGGTDGDGAATPSGPPVYEKGDFPEDLIPP